MSGVPELASNAVRDHLRRDPAEATYLGDHSHDDRLGDPSAAAADDRAAEIRATLAGLDALPPGGSVDAEVDAAVLSTVLSGELLDLDAIREDEWNPMRHNPGPALHALLSREFAPLPERLASVAARLAAVPEYLAAARQRLGVMSAPHVRTALTQLDGTLALIDDEIPAAAARAGLARPESEPARAAVIAHRDWLAERVADADRSARLGPDLFRAKLALVLDTAFEPERLLARAETELERVRLQIVDAAGRFADVARPDHETVRTVLDRLAEDATNDETILGLCRDAVADTTRFVRDRDLVTVFDDPIAVVAMPEIDRGIAAAYCRQNGPLETAILPTEFAVSPTPAGWSAAQVASFYRENNRHMIADLTIHEAMPGHALQLMHANRHAAGTPVRAVWSSGSFVEGWAVYSEALMAEHGYGGPAVRMQQLKMALRMIINTILDIRFHCDDLDEDEAMALMLEQGFQERSEAAGKWRRVQLSSTQLCTYFVGWWEVSRLAADLRAAHPSWKERRVHDAMLTYGSPPARHLRAMLELSPADV